MEAVTMAQNLARGDFTRLEERYERARQITHCPSGHLLSGDNVYRWRGQRHCRPCHREAQRRYAFGRA
jgi:hypothetical protein